MNHTLAITRRELSEKSFVLIAPAAAALIIFLLPFLPHVRQSNWREIYVVGSAVLAILFTAGLSVILGTSIVGREITERRMSFYFTKPLAAPAIWFGKLIAAAILLTSTFVVAMLPSFIAGRVILRSIWTGRDSAFLIPFAIAVTMLFFIGHILSTIARSRSSWAFVDLTAVVLFGYAWWSIIQPLWRRQAIEMLTLTDRVLGWLLLIVVVAAGAWQLTAGRTDRVQSHRALSKFLWAGTAVALSICALIVGWVMAAKPSDLKSFSANTSPDGAHAVIGGLARHRLDYPVAFSVDLRTGDYTRISDDRPMLFTPDGTKLVMFRPMDRRNAKGELVLRSASLRSAAEPTGLTIGERDFISMTPDGSRIAYGEAGTLAVYDVRNKSSIGSARLPWGVVSSMWFVSPDLVRAVVTAPVQGGPRVTMRTIQVYEYDLAAQSINKTGEYPTEVLSSFVSASADGSLLYLHSGPEEWSALDARTAAVAFKTSARIIGSTSDGRLIAAMGRTLQVLAKNGAVERELQPSLAGEYWSARAVAPDKMFVMAKGEGTGAAVWRYAVVDLNTGATIRSAQDVQPIFSDRRSSDPRRIEMNPNQLFMDAAGNLVRWNVLTNERNVVVRPGKL